MFPTLGSIGPFTFYSFGLMAAIAVVLAGVFLAIDLRQRGLDPSNALEIVVGAAIGGFLGARIYYLIEHWGEPGEGLFSGSGLVWYGGVAGGVIGVILIATWKRIPLGVMANAAAAPLALAYVIGRIGCQLAGDGDYGSATSLPWGMSYPDGTVPTTEIVHPTPIYESIAMLVVFWVLWRFRGRLTAPWSLFGLYLVLAGIERLLVEFVRRTPTEFAGLTTAQIISVGLILIGLPLVWRGIRSGSTGADPPLAPA
ncbi:MAG: prolipoprotein diacylglyceryl transferase family protein [Thermoleophilia bacterium]